MEKIIMYSEYCGIHVSLYDIAVCVIFHALILILPFPDLLDEISMKPRGVSM